MARNGKIARLPLHLRNELNGRLRDSELGKSLLAWLNAEPEVKEMLEDLFDGKPINKQSLSQWRRGGYQDWLRHQESRDLVRSLAEQAGELAESAEEQNVTDMLAGLMAVELARAVRALLAEEQDPKERWRRLQEIMPLLAQARRADHRAARLQMQQERWERERERLEREDDERELQEAKSQALASITSPMRRSTLVEAFGGGKGGEKIADSILEIQNAQIPRRRDPFEGEAETESDPVRVSQGKNVKQEGGTKTTLAPSGGERGNGKSSGRADFGGTPKSTRGTRVLPAAPGTGALPGNSTGGYG